jgi:TolB-like protein/DNA-binding winged helix-turn-helix (wHTH) protein/Tfp pilus assembly protein PilF
MQEERKSQVVRFGVFEANLTARELRKHGTNVRLRGQPFYILSLLLERPGEVVTRDEMRQKLWPADTFVDFEHSLNSAIKKLRAVLGDSPDNSRYIETIPRLGYRFVAPVQEVPPPGVAVVEVSTNAKEAQALAAPQISRRRWPLFVAGGLAVVALAALATFAWRKTHLRPGLGGEKVALAVLPFSNLTGDAGQEYFSDGLTEEMIAQLGRVDPERLSVIARTSVMHYKGSSETLPEIGRELGVQYVLEGSVRRDSERVRITTQLVRVKDQIPVWSRQYDRELAGLLTLQHEVAEEVADEMQVTLGEKRKAAGAPVGKPAAPPDSYETYDLYLQGRYFWNKRTKEGFQRAADYFQQAIARDPNYARAYAGLADTDGLMSTWYLGPQNELMPKGRAAAQKALQLDDTLAEAHTSLALIAENYDYDWQTAEKEFKRAIQLDPSYATAHQWYAEYLSWMGRFDEALVESEKARQLDPLSMIIAADHAMILYFARQYNRAIAQAHTVLNMDPTSSRAENVLINSYVQEHRFAEAQEFIDEHHKEGVKNQWIAIFEAIIYGNEGRDAEAQEELSRAEQFAWKPEQRIPALLVVNSAVGRKDETIALLQEAVLSHSNTVTAMKVDPMYDFLRSDPRFQEVLRRVGLADTGVTGLILARPDKILSASNMASITGTPATAGASEHTPTFLNPYQPTRPPVSNGTRHRFSQVLRGHSL